MRKITQSWQKLFLLCFGIFLGTAFCMKWMEADFIMGGNKFTIIGLEISYSREQVSQILSSIDQRVKTILQYHLYFDFAFMAGVYPGIFSLCMIARQRSANRSLRNFLLIIGMLQAAALCCDVTENVFLLKWIGNQGQISHFGFYHLIVIIKWAIALLGALVAFPLTLRKYAK